MPSPALRKMIDELEERADGTAAVLKQAKYAVEDGEQQREYFRIARRIVGEMHNILTGHLKA